MGQPAALAFKANTMINFFRRIRKQLADDNQFFKYSRYAIGEILLVVIGILIALQINNWNERRSQKDQLHQYLGTLVKELNDDRESLMSGKRVNAYRVHSMQWLLQFAGLKPIDFGGPVVMGIIPYEYHSKNIWVDPFPDSLNIRFIEAAISWVGRNADSGGKKTYTMDELNNTGMFSKMENTELKSALAHYYYEMVETLRASNIKETKYTDKWEQSFIDDGLDIYNMRSMEDPLSLLRDNKSRVEILKLISTEANWRARLAEWAIEEIDELIPLIQAEIKN